MADERLSVPVAYLARMFNLTERRVQQLASDGIIPKAERNRYHLVESVMGYVKFLQGRAYGKSDNATDSHHERTRYLKSKADLQELDLAERRGELVRREGIRKQDFSLGRILRNNLQTLPDRAAPILAAETDVHKVHSFIAAQVNESLEQVIERMESLEVDESELDIGRRESAAALEAAAEVAEDSGDAEPG